MAMIERILVPLDGSPLSETALPWAELLAERTRAAVVELRAAVAHAFPGADQTDAQVAAVREAEEYIERTAARLRERGFTTETSVPYGEPGDAIVEAAGRRNADLIVMATHGRSGLGRWIYGSVADRVLRSATMPVLLVRSGALKPLGGVPQAKILVPLDGSTVAEAALPWADELAGLLQASIVLLRVIELPPLDEGSAQRGAATLEAAQVDARSYLQGVARRVGSDGRELSFEVRLGLPPGIIGEYAREVGCELIVMATHGRSGVARLVYGSVAAGVLREASVPILLVPARGLEAARVEARAPATAGVRDAALLAAPAALTLTVRQVLLLREAINAALWLGKAEEDEERTTQLRSLLDVLPTAEQLRARAEIASGRAGAKKVAGA